MARQDRDSQYGGGSYNSEKNNSGRTQSYGGDNNRENYTNTPAAKASAKKAATISKANKIKNDATAFDNYTYTAPKFAGSILAIALGGIGKKGFETNKAYYEKNVIGKNNFTKSIDSYKDYMSKRGSGEIDAMGRAISGGGGGGVPNSSGGPNITQTAPTTAEVSQSEAANADADTEANRLLKIKKRGRSQSIMTGSKGVTKTSTDYSLGKKSLLGRV